jgi:hypothetical protein
VRRTVAEPRGALPPSAPFAIHGHVKLLRIRAYADRDYQARSGCNAPSGDLAFGLASPQVAQVAGAPSTTTIAVFAHDWRSFFPSA